MFSGLPILLFAFAVVPVLATNVVTLTTYTTTTICPITETLTSKGRTRTQTRITTSTITRVIPKTVVLPGPTSTVTEQVGVNVTQFSTRYVSQPATPTVVTLHNSSTGTTNMDVTTVTVPKTGPNSQPSSRKDISTSGIRSVSVCLSGSSLCLTPPPANSDTTGESEPTGAVDFSPKPTVEKPDVQSAVASRPAEPQGPIPQSNTEHVPQDLVTEGPPDIILSPSATAISLPSNAALATCPPVWLGLLAVLVALCAIQQ